MSLYLPYHLHRRYEDNLRAPGVRRYMPRIKQPSPATTPTWTAQTVGARVSPLAGRLIPQLELNVMGQTLLITTSSNLECGTIGQYDNITNLYLFLD